MTNFDETLSAAFDGECTAAELDRLLDACGRSPALMQRFGRYCASRDARAGVYFNFDAEALCSAVMTHIDPPRHARVVALRARTRAALRPMAGLALAASVGALATFSVYRFNLGTGVTALPGAAATAAAGPSAQVAQATPSASATNARWTQMDPSTARQLDDYMMEHASYRSEQGMGSALNYARMAAQDIQYRAADGSP